MSQVYCGVDLGSTTFHLAAVSADGEVLADVSRPTSASELRRTVVDLPAPVAVNLEEGERADWARATLLDVVDRVVVTDPRTNHWIARDPHKCDRVDAFKLAQLLRMGQGREVYHCDDRARVLFKRVVQHDESLAKDGTRIKNRIKSHFRMAGVPYRSSVWSEAGRQSVLAQILDEPRRDLVLDLYAILDATTQVRERAQKRMFHLATSFPEVALLRTAPGIGPLLACRFSAYVQDPRRFPTKRHLWSYAGLNVVSRTSDGRPVGRQRLDPSGVRPLKDLSRKAFIAATRTRGDNSFKRSYLRALHTSHNETHARLSTQRKILTVLRAIWLSGQPYQCDMP